MKVIVIGQSLLGKEIVKLSNWDLFGFFFDTILKSFFVNFFLSSDCTNIFSLEELYLKISMRLNFDASINLKFFFFLKL